MNIVAFLERVLPAAPFYAGLSATPGSDYLSQQAFSSIHALAAYVSKQSATGNHTYFGCSGFAQAWHDSPTGKLNDNGTIKQEFRTQNNSVAQKAFWLDVDVGASKAYKSQAEAIEALKIFLGKTQLPVPMVVSSGYGIHLYWTLSEQIESVIWRKWAGMLDALVRHFSFHVDPSRTMDTASILRVPGTYNYKYDTRSPVEVLVSAKDYDTLQFCTTLLNAVKQYSITPTQPTTNTPKTAVALPTAILNDPEFRAAIGWTLENKVIANKDPLAIVKGCKQIREAGRESEPVWFKMMIVAKFCEQGDVLVHELSKIDPRYNYKNTQRKFEYAKELDGGPTTCETFNRECPGKCESCAYFGKITSPVELGRKTPQQPESITLEAPTNSLLVQKNSFAALDAAECETQKVTVPTIKSKAFYVSAGKGVIFILEEDVKDGEKIKKEKIICDAELYPMCVHIYIDIATGRTTRYYVWRKVVAGKPTEDILMTDDEASNARAMTKWFANNAILPPAGFDKQLGAFVRTYLSQVQNKLPEIYVKDHFGWTDTKNLNGETVEAFVVGSTMYAPNMTPQPVNLDPRCRKMAEEYSSAGTLEEWKKIPEMYSVLNQPEAQFAICAGFAAPFMRYSNGTATNTILNFWEPVGGVGKSTILYAVNSIWGHPKAQILEQDDTDVARYMVAGTRRNLPVCMDEMTMIEDRALSSMLYMLANGRERRKGASGTDLADTGNWSTIFLMTSNNSILDKMLKYSPQSTAQVMRAMDIKVSLAAPEKARPYIEQTVGLMTHNYGLAGPYLMEKVMQNPHILQRLPEQLKRWNLEASTNPAERFWVYGCATILLIGNLAKHLGLINFDMDALEKWTLKLLDQLRKSVKGAKSDAAGSLVDFLNEKQNNTLVVKSAKRPVGSVDSADSVAPDGWVSIFPRSELGVRYELDSKTLYVSAKVLREWCKKNNISLDTLLHGLAMEKHFSFKGEHGGRKRIDLGAGVKTLGRGQAWCYVFSNLILGSPEEPTDKT